MICDPELGEIICVDSILLILIIINLLICLTILLLDGKPISHVFKKAQDLLRNTPK